MLEVLPSGVEERGPNRLSFDSSGTFITALLILASAVMIGGALAIVVLAGFDMIAAAFMPIAFGGVLALFARHRLKTMGTFVIDGDEKVFIHEVKRVETWSFDQVRAIETSRNHFVRTPLALFKGQPRWLLITVADGRCFRLCSAFKDELAPLLQKLSELGLPVRR